MACDPESAGRTLSHRYEHPSSDRALTRLDWCARTVTMASCCMVVVGGLGCMAQSGRSVGDSASAAALWLIDQVNRDDWFRPGREGVRENALVLLALSAEGPSRPPEAVGSAMWRVASWLLDQQDEQGRWGFDSVPDWCEGHVMAAYAVSEYCRVCGHELSDRLMVALENGVVHCAKVMESHRPSASQRFMSWSALLADSLRFSMPCAAEAENDDVTKDLRGDLEVALDRLWNAFMRAPVGNSGSIADRCVVRLSRGEACDMPAVEPRSAAVLLQCDPWQAILVAIAGHVKDRRSDWGDLLPSAGQDAVAVRLKQRWGRAWLQVPIGSNLVAYNAERLIALTLAQGYCRLNIASLDSRALRIR